jgi:hypothetical protein
VEWVKKLIIIAVVLVLVFIVALNPSIVAGPALSWVADNPKDPSAPDVLYRAARWCDWLGSDDKARAIYVQLYQQYPERADLCAPALYYLAYNFENGSLLLGVRRQAIPYLEALMNQYSSQTEWQAKAKQLYDEVNKAH